MSDGINQKPQWELVADAVAALGGQANRHRVWDYLKQSLPDIPFSTVTAELNSVSVNSPARTSYNTGREPRRTDTGNRYDRLFKIGTGPGSHYVVYDPAVHGVWEVYPDLSATSTHKTSIRKIDAGAFNAQAAMDYLDQRYPATYRGTSHIAAHRNQLGRQLAFDPGKDPSGKAALQLFVDARPPHLPDQAITEYPAERARNHHLAAHAPRLAAGNTAYSVRISSLSELDELCNWYDSTIPDQASEPRVSNSMTTIQPVNKILFGPPGTGKTYHTVNEALRILDPRFLASNESKRKALKDRYDELVAERRIRFVTFHQSFSYEDFVEGIRADAEGGHLEYRVQPGVFREICEDASGAAQVASEIGIREDARIWKISIDGTVRSPSRDYCFRSGEARIGWNAVGDLSNPLLSEIPAYATLGDNDRSTLHLFSREIEPGDVLLCIGSEKSVRAIGVVQGEYRYDPTPPPDVRQDFVNLLPVNWLETTLDLDVRPINGGRTFTAKTVYELTRFGWSDLVALLEEASIRLNGADAPQAKALPHVLIIDEINRGNVSRIFGELITLIEPSKRKGADEAMEVVLPYSRSRFSVPRNVHIIGTMNTADRSLAGLDVALRRRFEFTEMLPDVGALSGIDVAGIPVDTLLSTMNRRIEVLLGRDYMLGHAYFMRLDAMRSMGVLAEIFQRQVLPLLQEYFFADWQKIARVLNDHQKDDDELKFVRQINTGADLFGDMELAGEGRLWEINTKAFHKPEAYRAIIKAPQSAKVPQVVA